MNVAASPPSSGRGLRLTLGADIISLDSARLVVGRSRSCDVRLRDDTVSRLHAALVWRGGTLVLEDLGSSNGTWVNGERILSPRSVVAGDTVRFGSVKGMIEAGATPPATPGLPVAPAVATEHTHGLVLGKPATFGRRLVALLADIGLFALGSALPFLPLLVVVFGETRALIPPTLLASLPTKAFFAGVCGVLWLLFVFIYVIDGWARRGGSPGMRALGLRLFDWRQRIPIGYTRAWLRLGAVLVTCMTLGLGFLLIAFRKDRRALHDLLAGTIVAHPPRRATRRPPS
jgi:uncharacterized RDD family membrane protein YckC